ncbi:MAG: CoA transferase [Gammaproteobacteria bacterium]|nr:MAG: CoA transferase [Gammaproteobacteria bacterium]
MQPLEGVTVVTLEHAIAAPLATRHLADLGARVIKIERPGSGDFARGYDQRVNGLCSHFVWCNRSKESLALDAKHPEAADILARLVGRADVLMQNLAPGAATRLGLGYESLVENHPELIVCDISGYGDNGPSRDRKAYDLLIQSEAGLLSVTGSPDQMAKTGISIADIAAGMYAYSQVLAALIQRGRTGRGTRIEVSMLEALGEWMGYPLYYAYEGAEPPPRTGAFHATIYPYGPFATADGEVMLGLQNEREWQRFCSDVLKRPELATDARFSSNFDRSAHREALDAEIHAVFSTLTVNEVEARLDQAPIANARVNDMAALWSHPQLAARERWRTIDSPVGPLPSLLPPGTWHDDGPRMDPVPALGEHTDAILMELGYDDATIGQLRNAGAVG